MGNLISRVLIPALFVALSSLGLAAPASARQAPPDRDTLTSFFRAVQMDDVRTVEKMVAGRVVNPNQRDPRNGESALLLALREGSAHVTALLIALPGLDLEQQAPNGNTALMMAAFKHNQPVVEALLARGAQVNRTGYTPLHFAAAAGDEAIVRLLLTRGAAVDARAPAGITPLMMAAREGQESVIAALLDGGADAALTNSEQLTAAQIAERAEKPRIARAIQGYVRGVK
jgi:ankyrin repeat protein